MSLMDNINKIKDIVQQSSVIDVKTPIRTSQSLNAQYQSVIDERLYSYRDDVIKLLQQQGMDASGIDKIKTMGVQEFATELRHDLDEMFNAIIPENQRQLMQQLGESTTYSGLYFGETIANRPDAFIEMIRGLPYKQEAILLRKNDSVFLFAHGSPKGNIMFDGAEYAPEKFIQRLYDKNLIPDDIKKLYTMNCYGGKQQSFIGPNGVEVKSAHSSTTPIMGTAMLNLDERPMFGVSLNTGDIIDEVKELSMAEGELKVLYSPSEINEALTVKPKQKVWRDVSVESVETVLDIEPQLTEKVIEDIVTVSTPQPEPSKRKLSSQEAFEKYGVNDDRFYTSQGLNPETQKQAVQKLNSGRQKIDTTPIEIKEFQQKLDSLGITEQEYYNRLNKELKSPLDSPRRKTAKGPKLKRKTINNPVSPTIKTPKTTKTLPKKTIGGGGKAAISLAIVALGAATLLKDDNKERGKKQAHHLSRSTNSRGYEDFNDGYAQQMAADISSYRYGKHMTGFVNF